MPVKRGRIKLRQYIDPLDFRVDAVADGNVDQAILAGERNGGFGAKFSQRVEPGSGASAQDDG
jgi:hypothetical protein